MPGCYIGLGINSVAPRLCLIALPLSAASVVKAEINKHPLVARRLGKGFF